MSSLRHFSTTPDEDKDKKKPHEDLSIREALSDRKITKDEAKRVAQTKVNRFVELWRKYGVVAVATYFSIYFGTLGSLYLLFDYDIIGASNLGFSPEQATEMLAGVLDRVHAPDSITSAVRGNAKITTFAMAWLTAKFTEPLRLLATVFATPRIARFVGYEGMKSKKKDDEEDGADKKDKEEGSKI